MSQRMKIEPTINWGQILQLGGVIAAMFFAYSAIKSDVRVNVERIDYNRVAIARSLEELKDLRQETRREIKELNDRVNGLTVRQRSFPDDR